jgi:hypothetical protein
MKNSAVIVLLVAAVAFGGLYFREHWKARETGAKVTSLEEQVRELEGRLTQQETRSAGLQTRLKDTREQASAKADEVASLQQAITNQAETSAKAKTPMAEMFKGVGEMMKNPDTKEMIKTQQKAVLNGMMEKAYAALVNQLGLTPEQAAAFKDLVVNKSLAGAAVGMSLLSETDPEKRSQLLEQTKIEKDAYDLQIKQMLGDENYKQFQAYEKTLSDRMTVGMFRDQQATGPGVLAADQEAQLIQIMGEERQNFKFTTDLSDQSKVQSDLAGSLTEEKVNQFLQEQEQLQQRYLSRARAVLSDDQYASYQKFLSSQLQMQKLGLNMASQMFAPKQQGK